jgi:hypothetical protein
MEIPHAESWQVRAWARDNEWRDEYDREVADRGVLPRELRQAYLAATGVPYYQKRELKRLMAAAERNEAKAARSTKKTAKSTSLPAKGGGRAWLRDLAMKAKELSDLLEPFRA